MKNIFAVATMLEAGHGRCLPHDAGATINCRILAEKHPLS